MRTRTSFVAAAAMILCWGWRAASEASAITIPQGPGQDISPWGDNGAFATVGQTFTADSSLGLFLDDFTFYVENACANKITYDADVFAWNGSNVTGSPLLPRDRSTWPAQRPASCPSRSPLTCRQRSPRGASTSSC
jgi:hypothetical protein